MYFAVEIWLPRRPSGSKNPARTRQFLVLVPGLCTGSRQGSGLQQGNAQEQARGTACSRCWGGGHLAPCAVTVDHPGGLTRHGSQREGLLLGVRVSPVQARARSPWQRQLCSMECHAVGCCWLHQLSWLLHWWRRRGLQTLPWVALPCPACRQPSASSGGSAECAAWTGLLGHLEARVCCEVDVTESLHLERLNVADWVAGKRRCACPDRGCGIVVFIKPSLIIHGCNFRSCVCLYSASKLCSLSSSFPYFLTRLQAETSLNQGHMGNHILPEFTQYHFAPRSLTQSASSLSCRGCCMVYSHKVLDTLAARQASRLHFIRTQSPYHLLAALVDQHPICRFIQLCPAWHWAWTTSISHNVVISGAPA